MCRGVFVDIGRIVEGPSWLWTYGSWIYNYLCNQCLSPLKLWVRIPFMASCIRYIKLCNKDCQWLATGRWFSPGTPVSFTNKTDCHDITEILLKVALNTIILTLTRKLMNQWLLLVKLKSSLRKIYGHHLDFVNSYQLSVSQITTHMVPLS